MSEIEKMYENAGIKKQYCGWLDMGDLDTNMQYVRCATKEEYDDCVALSCADLIKTTPKEEYPPFTAEKQLELIKLLSYYYNITISKNFENDYKFQCEGDDVRPYVFTSGQDFAEQLAVFINMCFEYLPEEEKQQIKEILE